VVSSSGVLWTWWVFWMQLWRKGYRCLEISRLRAYLNTHFTTLSSAQAAVIVRRKAAIAKL
jgi:hypothetical protein